MGSEQMTPQMAAQQALGRIILALPPERQADATTVMQQLSRLDSVVRGLRLALEQFEQEQI